MAINEPFEIGDFLVKPGTREHLQLPLPGASGHLLQRLPVTVIHGKQAGPKVFICAAVHGDEVLGTEIIRQLLAKPALKRINGTLVVVPVVNIYGFIQHSRYLPDRRDLNRSFPGSSVGSLAARLANVLMTEVVERCTHGIDLHTAAIHRTNLPHLRICDDTKENVRLCQAFGVPVVLCSELRDGSLRQAVQDLGKPMLLFEGGEALRLDMRVARSAVSGILGVLSALEMLPPRKPPKIAATLTSESYWVRAHQAGLFHRNARLGDHVKRGQTVGFITDPFDQTRYELTARAAGILIGHCSNPVVNEGDGLFHVAVYSDRSEARDVAEAVGAYVGALENEHLGTDTTEGAL